MIKSFSQILRESKDRIYIGSCINIDNGEEGWDITNFYRDATELAQDLGYYSTFDPDEDPEDSNWMTISIHDFNEKCIGDFLEGNYIYLRRKEPPYIYCAYNKSEDVHYFFY